MSSSVPIPRYLLLLAAASASACGDEPSGHASRGSLVTNAVVFGDDATSSYVTLLPSLESGDVELSGAREFAGWADVWVHDGKVFVSDGEAPELTRFSVDESGALVGGRQLSFQRHGAESAAFWTNLFVSSHKAPPTSSSATATRRSAGARQAGPTGSSRSAEASPRRAHAPT